MRIFTALAAAVVGGACLFSTASAEVDYLAEIYGEGVHAFYDGDWTQAEKHFNQAISNGYKDPRCYYYRAILYLRQCRDYEAERDIQAGARFELEGRGTYDIGRAIYRFQGHQRIKFERLRRDAKLELATSRAVPSRVIQPNTTPPSSVMPGFESGGIPDIPPGLTDPFADDEAETEQPVEEDSTDAEVDDEGMFDDLDADAGDDGMFDDGAGDDGGFDDITTDDDSLGTADADATDPAGDDSDPFGSDDSDPFGDDGGDDLFDGF